MRMLPLFLVCTALLHGSTHVYAQQVQPASLPLTDFSAFQSPGSNWSIASDAVASYNKAGHLKAIAGQGTLVDVLGNKQNTNLVTKQEYGDVQLELDFMMAKNSNSGVYLQGRYEVQLLDSWTKLKPLFSDCGGIYQRYDEAKASDNGYEGIAPLMNAAKAPGLWQHLFIQFRAPRFDANGNKVTNARFQKVVLNGVVVQQEASVTGPTRSALFTDEKALGPLMLQGDHGDVAFRNISFTSIDSTQPDNQGWDNPILINPEKKPYLLRSFLNDGTKKLTHVISVGSPLQLNYSYDLKQGALFQVWRGQFLDVTDMWHERGEPQLAKPIGAVVKLSDAPALAVLADGNAAWPDSIAFDDMHNKGYTLDSSRYPTFHYLYNGLEVYDKIYPQSNGESLIRELHVTGPSASLYCRVTTADDIVLLEPGLYAVNHKSYYINLPLQQKAQIRTNAQGGKELLLALQPNVQAITYSITW